MGGVFLSGVRTPLLVRALLDRECSAIDLVRV